MGSGYCTALKLRILDVLFGSTAFTKDTTLYVGLAATSVDADGVVTGEPVGNNYSRVSFTNNDASKWSAASGTGSKTNANGTFQFPVCQTGNWGTMTKFFIANHASNTGAAILLWGDLSPSVTINVGDQAIFNTSQLTVTLS